MLHEREEEDKEETSVDHSPTGEETWMHGHAAKQEEMDAKMMPSRVKVVVQRRGERTRSSVAV